MDLDNLKEAAEIYDSKRTLTIAEGRIDSLFEEDNWNEDSLVLIDKDTQIEIDLTNALNRALVLNSIRELISRQQSKLDERIKDL